MRRTATLFVMAGIVLGLPAYAGKADREIDAWKKTLPAPDADYGPFPGDFEQIIKTYLAKSLKDPESARYSEFSKPRKEHAITNARQKLAVYGYSACVLVNAKNSYGGYTGDQQYWFLIRNGEVVRSSNVTSGMNIIYLGRKINCENGA